MTTIRLRGIAHRETPGRSGLDPTTIVPETVPVYVEYAGTAIGTAALRRDDDDTIWADATVEDGPWRETCRFFGMSFRCGHLAEVPGAGLGEAIAVSLTASVLSNKLIPGHRPPFEVADDDFLQVPWEAAMSCGKTVTRRQAKARTSSARAHQARRAATPSAKAAKARYRQQSYAAFVRQLRHYYHVRHLQHVAHQAAAAAQAPHPAKRRAARAAARHGVTSRIRCKQKTRKAAVVRKGPAKKKTAPAKSRAVKAAAGRRAALPSAGVRAARSARSARARRGR